MAKYGNIMTVFNSDDAKVQQIIGLLTGASATFVHLENTFYIETNSRDNTRKIVEALPQLNIEYIFFHNKISDGSEIKHTGLDPQFIEAVNRILFL